VQLGSLRQCQRVEHGLVVDRVGQLHQEHCLGFEAGRGWRTSTGARRCHRPIRCAPGAPWTGGGRRATGIRLRTRRGCTTPGATRQAQSCHSGTWDLTFLARRLGPRPSAGVLAPPGAA
jgi:hypothetical protein